MNTKLQYFFYGFLAIVIAIIIISTVYKSAEMNIDEESNYEKITIGGAEFYVEVPRTREEKVKGLSGRKGLAAARGMLFVFDKPGVYDFWMKDMMFPIDIIWIGEDNRVAAVTKNAAPESYPRAFFPPVPILSAIEVKAGFIEAHKIQAGDVFLE